MPREGTVTIRVDYRTKRWLEAYQTHMWKRTGKRPNNDEAIALLLQQVDPEAVTEGDEIYDREDVDNPKRASKKAKGK